MGRSTLLHPYYRIFSSRALRGTTAHAVPRCSSGLTDASYACSDGGRATYATASAALPPNIKEAFGYCIQQVRQFDYPNYVWVAQMPKALRPALFALRAFNIETAQVAELVRSREAVVGQIRFQWWRDAVRAAFDGRPPSHPVALALAHVIASSRATGTTGAGPTATVAASGRATGMDNGAGDAAGGRHAGCGSGCGVDRGPANGAEEGDASAAAAAGAHASSSAAARMQGAGGGGGMAGSSPYSRYSFKRIIDAREADFLDPQPPLELAALESYAEGTASQLMYLQLAAAGVRHADADHAASHLGRAVGLTTLLRGTPAHAAARRSYLPVDLCAQHRVSQEDVYSGVVSEGLRDVVHAVASLAKGHLDEARRLAPRLPKGAAGVMLPAVGAGRYLDALERANFDPWAPGLAEAAGSGGAGKGAPLGYVLAVKYHQLMGTY